MTDETKKLFDAPWKVCLEKRGSFYRPCVCSSDTKIASVCTKENANRLVRLPELYNALVETTYAKCYSCHIQKEQKPTTQNRSDYIESGCTFHKDNCYFQKVWELLRKVREGK